VVLLSASVSHAVSIFDVLTSAVKATVSGVNKTVSNANPAKIISDTTEGTVEAGQKAGEATVGGVTNTVGVVSQATGN
jgi:hypothetical protein